MKSVMRIAARNAAASRKRTLITVLTIAVALCSINIGKAVMSGMQRESKLNITESRTGEIQIHRRGYLDAGELTLLDYAVDDFSQLQDELEGIPGVRHVAGRIQFGGLLAKEDDTAVVFCRAVDTEAELRVCPRIKDNIIEGRFLAGDEASEAVIANGLKKGIRTTLGDSVIIVATTEDGYQNAVELEIVGVIEEKMAQANTRLVYLPMGVAQDFLYMNDKVNEIVIKTDAGTEIGALSRTVNQKLRGRLLRSNTWKEAATFFADVMRKQNVVVVVISLIFYFIIISSITNTMTLTVFERKREIGTMMAVGIKARDVIQLIITESMFIGALGSVVGIFVSIVAIAVLGKVGLTRTPPDALGPITIYPTISFPFMLMTLMLGVLSAVAGSIYPARRILAVDPADALRSP